MYNPMTRSCITHERGKTERLAGQAFEARPQRKMLSFNLLYHQLPYCMPLGREMPLVDTRLVRVVTRNAKGCKQSAELQECRVLPGADHIDKHVPCATIERMPEPPRGRFGPNITPHFIQLGGALWLDAGAAGARTRGGQREGGVPQRGDFFLIWRSPSWD